MLGNYGSLDLFAAVDLGLSSLKSGRSPSTSTRSKPILDQVQVRSVHRLILPEMSTSPSANSDLKREVQRKWQLCHLYLPTQTRDHDFPAFSHPNHPHLLLPALGKHRVLSKLHCSSHLPPIWTIPSHHFGLFNPIYLDYRNPRVRRSRSMDTSISVDPLPSQENTPRSIFRRSIPRESVVRVYSYPTLHTPLRQRHTTEMHTPQE